MTVKAVVRLYMCAVNKKVNLLYELRKFRNIDLFLNDKYYVQDKISNQR